MPKYQYDPGEPYDPPPSRRRRQRFGDADDGWAAADEDDFYDDDVEIEDLAPGYVDHERDGRGPDDGWNDDGSDWTPPPYRRQMRERGYPAERERYERGPGPRGSARPRSDRRAPYGDDRTYHRDRANRGEYGAYREKAKRKSARTDYPPTGPMRGVSGIPFWQILMVVVLAVFALFAAVLACASILFLL